MSPSQHQALVLSGISLAAFILFVGLLPWFKGSRFGVFAAINLLLAALFGAQVVLDLSGWRTEIVAALLTELPVVFVVSWICLAQAGRLPTGFVALPAEPVARRPRLRIVLRSAPLVLLLAVAMAAAVGLAWPSPALQAYSPAPPQFVVFKWTIAGPEGFYAGLAALIFALAARSPASALPLRLKNFAFFVGSACLALIALNSAFFAGVRLWASDSDRRPVLEGLLALEAYLAILCVFAFILGLAMRYTPAVASGLLRGIHTGWLLTQERFEALKWQMITTGRARGAIRASHYVSEAAKLQGLSPSDTEKAVTTIQLLAVMNGSSVDGERITPKMAHELYELQEEVMRDGALASKIGWSTGLGSRGNELQTVESAPLHDALGAALQLVDQGEQGGAREDGPVSSSWYHLAVVGAADGGLIDPAHIRRHLGDRIGHRTALQAYRAAKSQPLSQTIDDR